METTPLFPRDAADLVEIVAAAQANQQPLELIGQASKRGLGAPVSARPVVMTGFTGIQLYEPDELVLTAGANTPMALIHQTLAASGQHLAFDPPNLAPFYGVSAELGSLAGVLSANLAGPRRLTAGAARDHLLGFQAVSGRAESFKAGARVVKNVTGYDLPKVIAGSFGTLAALTEVTVKVLPRPETEATLVLSGLSDADAIARLSIALGSPNDVSCAAHLPARVAGSFDLPGAATLIRLEGFGPSVAARRHALIDLCGDGLVLDGDLSRALWISLRDLLPLVERPDLLVWRVSVPPSAGPAVMKAIAAGGLELGWYDWAGGLLWLGLAAEESDGGANRIRAALTACGGHATLMRAPIELRATVPVFQPQPDGLAALTRRVKHGFDPLNLFNPGRMAPLV